MQQDQREQHGGGGEVRGRQEDGGEAGVQQRDHEHEVEVGDVERRGDCAEALAAQSTQRSVRKRRILSLVIFSLSC